MIYRHEQIGRIYIESLGVLAVICIALALALPQTTAWLTIAAVLTMICIAFARLTIGVDESGVAWNLTFGVPGGHVPVDAIESAEIVPVSFWYGIGIHLTLRGWVWNVALGRGVQIHRRDGTPVVLGTYDPDGLLDAIERARERA